MSVTASYRFFWFWWQFTMFAVEMVNTVANRFCHQHLSSTPMLQLSHWMHRSWWQMLETKDVGDNFQMLLTDLLHRKSHQHLRTVIIIKSLIHYTVTRLRLFSIYKLYLLNHSCYIHAKYQQIFPIQYFQTRILKKDIIYIKYGRKRPEGNESNHQERKEGTEEN